MTKQEQIEILQGAVRRLKAGECQGICTAIRREIQHAYGIEVSPFAQLSAYIPGFTYENVESLCEINGWSVPDVEEHAPFWWGSFYVNVRILVLNLLIEELKTSLEDGCPYSCEEL